MNPAAPIHRFLLSHPRWLVPLLVSAAIWAALFTDATLVAFFGAASGMLVDGGGPRRGDLALYEPAAIALLIAAPGWLVVFWTTSILHRAQPPYVPGFEISRRSTPPRAIPLCRSRSTTQPPSPPPHFPRCGSAGWHGRWYGSRRRLVGLIAIGLVIVLVTMQVWG